MMARFGNLDMIDKFKNFKVSEITKLGKYKKEKFNREHFLNKGQINLQSSHTFTNMENTKETNRTEKRIRAGISDDGSIVSLSI